MNFDFWHNEHMYYVVYLLDLFYFIFFSVRFILISTTKKCFHVNIGAVYDSGFGCGEGNMYSE